MNSDEETGFWYLVKFSKGKEYDVVEEKRIVFDKQDRSSVAVKVSCQGKRYKATILEKGELKTVVKQMYCYSFAFKKLSRVKNFYFLSDRHVSLLRLQS